MAKTKKDTLLSQWRTAQKALAAAKKKESDLRSQVIALFANAKQREGTENVETKIGILAFTKRLKFALMNKKGETKAVAAQLPEDIAGSLLDWTPKLNVTEYRKIKELAAAEKRNGKWTKILNQIDSVLTISEGTPQVKLK